MRGVFFLPLRLLWLARWHPEPAWQLFLRTFAGSLFLLASLNVLMVLNWAPVSGVPLPFVSYGGSFYWALTMGLFWSMLGLPEIREARRAHRVSREGTLLLPPKSAEA